MAKYYVSGRIKAIKCIRHLIEMVIPLLILRAGGRSVSIFLMVYVALHHVMF
jgi:hypothetical protein